VRPNRVFIHRKRFEERDVVKGMMKAKKVYENQRLRSLPRLVDENACCKGVRISFTINMSHYSFPI
jgi:hypothetical protein